jgi:hypothetical protein
LQTFERRVEGLRSHLAEVEATHKTDIHRLTAEHEIELHRQRETHATDLHELAGALEKQSRESDAALREMGLRLTTAQEDAVRTSSEQRKEHAHQLRVAVDNAEQTSEATAHAKLLQALDVQRTRLTGEYELQLHLLEEEHRQSLRLLESSCRGDLTRLHVLLHTRIREEVAEELERRLEQVTSSQQHVLKHQLNVLEVALEEKQQQQEALVEEARRSERVRIERQMIEDHQRELQLRYQEWRSGPLRDGMEQQTEAFRAVVEGLEQHYRGHLMQWERTMRWWLRQHHEEHGRMVLSRSELQESLRGVVLEREALREQLHRMEVDAAALSVAVESERQSMELIACQRGESRIGRKDHRCSQR